MLYAALKKAAGGLPSERLQMMKSAQLQWVSMFIALGYWQVLSCVLLAVAGIAYSYYLGTISARPFYFNHVFLTLAMLILGGMRTVTEAVLGTFLISFGLEWVRWLETGPTVLGLKFPEVTPDVWGRARISNCSYHGPASRGYYG